MYDNETSSADRDQRLLYLAIGATIVGLILLIVFTVLLLRGGEDDEEAVDATATPDVIDVGVIATPSPEVFVNVYDTSSAIPISVTVDTPVAMTITDQRFQLQSVRASPEGVWTPNLPNETTAAWVYGTFVNYVIGVPDSAANRALVDGLQPGDVFALARQDGSVDRFVFDRREIVPNDGRDVFGQHLPGVTLLLLGTEGTSRLMAHGSYVVPDTGAEGTSAVVELGETAQLDDWVVTVTGATLLADRTEAPPGFVFFLVDFDLENQGDRPGNADDLRFALVDRLGNQYALNTLAAQFGNHPLARGQLAVGQPLMATAGYQIPASLGGDSLVWIVSLADSESRLEVRLPLGDDGDGMQEAVVSVTQAEVSLDGTSLVLQGQVSNLDSRPLVIEEQDLFLTSGGTVYLLFSTNPGFPWVIAPGQTLPFSVQFQRPIQPDAIFTVLSYPFELTGLR